MTFAEIARRFLAESRATEQSRADLLKGHAIELWWHGESLFLVADEEDAKRLAEPRGSIYTRAEAEHLCTIRDPEVVAEVHEWKRRMNARIREVQR